MAEVELLIEVGVEAEGGQVRLSVTGAGAGVTGRGYGPRDAVSGAGETAVSGAGDSAVSGASEILVAVRDGGPVTVRVYDGRPDLHGWALVDTARLVVGTDGVDVGTVVSAVEHWVPVQEGTVTVEVWVRGPDEPGEVTFVLSR
ncbi:hypothetical protein AB0H83_15565 [Dactylosporangium sp. NPDC050688]|uniref:hypothetical protein n=1 Tax=Dactylosporangium sp. NPDC050688 TaxID=3157217 RepID=UPI003407817C